ncbi:MAG: ABC transporter ATP-binding protein, partial [Candidatus Thorarchaeota archaeon]
MIQLEDVYYSYDGVRPALRGVSLQIDDGSLVAIVGSNGAGKTTLIKHFNGLLRPDRGRVIIDGVDARSKSVAELSRTVGLVWQNPDHQLFLESVRKEITFGLRNMGFSSREAESRCQAALQRLGLSALADRSPFSLSGGERKRVALASVLAVEPKVLVLDEPTAGQDAGQKERLASMIHELHSNGSTVVVVTHDLEFVAEHLERTVAMSEGRIIADGRTELVLTNDRVLSLCSLTSPQISIISREMNRLFPDISPRMLALSEIQDAILK